MSCPSRMTPTAQPGESGLSNCANRASTRPVRELAGACTAVDGPCERAIEANVQTNVSTSLLTPGTSYLARTSDRLQGYALRACTAPTLGRPPDIRVVGAVQQQHAKRDHTHRVRFHVLND